MEKINIAELLKDCPKGMELDCVTWENVTFEKVVGDEIYIKRNRKTQLLDNLVILNKYGCVTRHEDEKCRIFPKGKKTWVGFHRPFVEGDIVSTESGMYIGIVKSTKDSHQCCTFCSIHGKKDFHMGKELLFSRFATKEEKQIVFDIIKANGYRWNEVTNTLEKLPKFKDGDIVFGHNSACSYITIYKSSRCEISFNYYACLTNLGRFQMDNFADNLNLRHATDEEKKRLFEEIKARGYAWNSETKTLEKLNEPCFKVWDKIRHKNDKTIIKTINYIYHDRYGLCDNHIIYFKEQDEWELVPNKFEIHSLKPFDQVLVRNSDKGCWVGQFYLSYNFTEEYPFECTYNCWKYCIPYKGNEYLLNKTYDCPNYYKTWE